MSVTPTVDQASRAKERLLIFFAVLCVGGAGLRAYNGQIDDTTLLYVGVAAAMLVVREISSLAIGDKFKLEFRKQIAEVKETAETAKDVAAKAIDSATKATEGADTARSVAEAMIENRIGRRTSAPRGDVLVRESTPKAAAAPNAVESAVLEHGDRQRGRWGGKSEANARKLSAKVAPVRDDDDWFNVRILVESTDPVRPLTGTVTFHLHQSFHNQDPVVKVRNGRAVLSTVAWGAFTVGAEADDGATKLELNLAELADAPMTFRER